MGERAFELTAVVIRGLLPEAPTFMDFANSVMRKADSSLLPDLAAGLRVTAQVSSLFEQPKASKGEKEWRPRSSWNLRADPIAIAVPLIAGFRAAMCFAALVDLCLEKRVSPPRWLVDLVVRGWVEGQRVFLRIPALFRDDVEVPTDLLPASERLTMEQVVREHNAAEDDFQRFIADSAR